MGTLSSNQIESDNIKQKNRRILKALSILVFMLFIGSLLYIYFYHAK